MQGLYRDWKRQRGEIAVFSHQPPVLAPMQSEQGPIGFYVCATLSDPLSEEDRKVVTYQLDSLLCEVGRTVRFDFQDETEHPHHSAYTLPTLLLGRQAAQIALRRNIHLASIRGRLLRHPKTGASVLVTYHPRDMRRSSDLAHIFENDLRSFLTGLSLRSDQRC